VQLPSGEHVALLMEAASASLEEFLAMGVVGGGLLQAQLFHGMVSAVEHFHSLGVAHRDLKPTNVLVSQSLDTCLREVGSCRSKITDFELACNEGSPECQDLGSPRGTPEYMAPELFAVQSPEGQRSDDMWALGVITYGLVFKCFPFKDEEDCKTKPVKCPTGTGNDGRAFIKATLTRDEGKRLTAQEALSHSFLSCGGACLESWLSERTEQTVQQCTRWTTKKVDMMRDFCRQPRR